MNLHNWMESPAKTLVEFFANFEELGKLTVVRQVF